ncbi:MAG: hypothetical protein OH337_03880 [Candidatus Parvarchaeota archaeon]|nr:hypothetical protein [Candidatus Haiyanarchaeum thermophilum]
MFEKPVTGKVKLECSRCGWEAVINRLWGMITVAVASYILDVFGSRLKCPNCNHPITAKPNILSPFGILTMIKVVISSKKY